MNFYKFRGLKLVTALCDKWLLFITKLAWLEVHLSVADFLQVQLNCFSKFVKTQTSRYVVSTNRCRSADFFPNSFTDNIFISMKITSTASFKAYYLLCYSLLLDPNMQISLFRSNVPILDITIFIIIFVYPSVLYYNKL